MSVRFPLKVLILGGYGTFGGRLAQLLVANRDVTLLIAGRSLARARAFCAALAPGAQREAIEFDRDGDASAQIRAVAPDWVVDATGPFQCYGHDPYRIIQACLALGIDYLDLADGADFVKGVEQFNAEARVRGVVVLSGVSSFPVLTAAVVRHLAEGLATVSSITGGIAPSPYAGVGQNVIRAIASYAGKPLALIRGGQRAQGIAMTESMRYTISAPGRLPLRNIRFSLVDVPDLQVLPALWPHLESVWMGAGPVPEVLHRLLNGLAWLVRWRILPSLLPLAPLMFQVSNRVRWGEDRGGMFVQVRGCTLGGAPITRSWHLLAEGADGPLIPSMACQAIIENSVAGRRPVAGARAATNDLELADYEALFARRTIYTGRRTTQSAERAPALYQRVLGEAWNALPPLIQAMHGPGGRRVAHGLADIDRGRGLLARLVALFIRFPATGRRVPVQVEFATDVTGERWTRTFANRTFSSHQSAGSGRSSHLLNERFGLLTFALAVLVEGAQLRLIVRRWSLCGVPLPAFLAPSTDAYESVVDGRFNFNVEIRHRLLGLIVAYRGWLEVAGAAPAR